MKKFIKSVKGFTLIEVSMAIALVAIGLTVAVLGYNGYQAWAAETAAKENSQSLVSAVAQAKALGVSVTVATPGNLSAAVANDIYSQIDGDITPAGASAPVQIVPAGFQVASTATFTQGSFTVSGGGVFTPLP